MNKIILCIISALCASAFPTSYLIYKNVITSVSVETLPEPKEIIAPFNGELIRHLATTRRKYIATEDIYNIYDRVYKLCISISEPSYKEELVSTIMLSNDIYNNARGRSIFSSSSKHLPFVQYVTILDRMMRLLNRREQDTLVEKLTFIRTTIIQQKEYRKEKMVFASKTKSSPFELLKFTFGIIKLI